MEQGRDVELRNGASSVSSEEWEIIMGDLVNLNRARKQAARERSAQQADANRVRYGRSKGERLLERQRHERAAEKLDQHRLDGRGEP